MEEDGAGDRDTTGVAAWRTGPASHGVTRAVPLAVPALAVEVVLRLQGYRDPTGAPRPVRVAAATATAEAARLVVPSAVVWRGPVTAVMPDGAVTSRLLARVLAGATAAYVALLTVGAALERRVEALFAERAALEGLLLDTAGSAAVMALGQDLRRWLLAQERHAGRIVTHRVSPGYGDWSVEAQHALVSLFGATRLPVSLLDCAMLAPRKSLSAVFGVVPTGERVARVAEQLAPRRR